MSKATAAIVSHGIVWIGTIIAAAIIAAFRGPPFMIVVFVCTSISTSLLIQFLLRRTGMTAKQIDDTLRARGIGIDPHDESFMEGKRVLKRSEVRRLLPEALEDQIASYAEFKAAELRRTVASAG